MGRVVAGAGHAGRLHLPSQAPELIVPAHTHSLNTHRYQSAYQLRHLAPDSPREAPTALGVPGGRARRPLLPVQQAALGAPHAGSYACVHAERPGVTRDTHTLRNRSPEDNAQLSCQEGETGGGRRCSCVTSESCSPGPHAGQATQVPSGPRNWVCSQLSSDPTSTQQIWGKAHSNAVELCSHKAVFLKSKRRSRCNKATIL